MTSVSAPAGIDSNAYDSGKPEALFPFDMFYSESSGLFRIADLCRWVGTSLVMAKFVLKFSELVGNFIYALVDAGVHVIVVVFGYECLSGAGMNDYFNGTLARFMVKDHFNRVDTIIIPRKLRALALNILCN